MRNGTNTREKLLKIFYDIDDGKIGGFVNLSDYVISTKDLERLCKIIQHKRKITDLNLGKNLVSREIINKLSEYLQRNNSLKPFYDAIEEGNLEEVKKLFLHNKNLHSISNDIPSPLRVAIYNGYIGIIRFFIENGLNVNEADYNGATPLIYATSCGRPTIVKFLLDKGAQVNTTCDNGRSALSFAVELGEMEIVRLLLEKNTNINAVDKLDRTPLYYAVRNDNLNMVKLLIEKGADVKGQTDGDFSISKCAVRHKRWDILNYLHSGKGLSTEHYAVVRLWMPKDNGKKILEDAQWNENIGHISVSIHSGPKQIYVSHLPDGGNHHTFVNQPGINRSLEEDLNNYPPDFTIILYNVDTKKMVHCAEKMLDQDNPWFLFGENSSSAYVYKVLEAGGIDLSTAEQELSFNTMIPTQVATLAVKANGEEKDNLDTATFLAYHLHTLKKELIEKSKENKEEVLKFFKNNPDFASLYKAYSEKDFLIFTTKVNKNLEELTKKEPLIKDSLNKVTQRNAKPATKNVTLERELLETVKSLDLDSKAVCNVALLKKIDFLLKQNADLTERDERNYNALHCAIEKKNKSCVEKLLSKYPESLNDKVQSKHDNPNHFLDSDGVHAKSVMDLVAENEFPEILPLLEKAEAIISDGRDLIDDDEFEFNLKKSNDDNLKKFKLSDSKDSTPATIEAKYVADKIKYNIRNKIVRTTKDPNEVILNFYKYFKKNIKWKFNCNLDEFIMPQVGYELNSEKSWNAEKACFDFINDPEKSVLMLIGKAEAGKSALTQVMTKKLWNNFYNERKEITEKTIPIWMHLPSIIKWKKVNDKSFLESYYYHLRLTKKEITDFKEYCEGNSCNIVLFLDGLDDIDPSDRELFIKEMHDYKGKKIITCRADSVISPSQQVDWKLLSDLVDGKSECFTELCLQDFNQEQIDLYLQIISKNLKVKPMSNQNEPDWSNWETYKNYILKIPSLAKLAKSPLLLRAIVIALPEIIKSKGVHSESERRLISKKILDIVIDTWLTAQAHKIMYEKNNEMQILISAKSKAVIDPTQDKIDFLKLCLEKYLKNLALFYLKKSKGNFTITLSDSDTLDPKLLSANLGEEGLFQMEGLQPTILKALRSCALLEPFRYGFKFLHPMLVEHLADYPKTNDVEKIVITEFESGFPIPEVKDAFGQKEKINIDYDHWAVSLLRNPYSENANHTFIILEGMNCWGQRILHRYDFAFLPKNKEFLPDLENIKDTKLSKKIKIPLKQSQALWKSDNCQKAHIVINDKIISNPEKYQADLMGLLGDHTCEDLSPYQVKGEPPIRISRQQAKQLHNSILKEKEKIYDFDTLGRGNKYNCYKWAYEKLAALNYPAITESLPKLKEGLFKWVPMASMKENTNKSQDKSNIEFDNAIVGAKIIRKVKF